MVERLIASLLLSWVCDRAVLRGEGEEALHVAGEDVGLEVDAVAGGARAERRRVERLGDQGDLEPRAPRRRRRSPR